MIITLNKWNALFGLFDCLGPVSNAVTTGELQVMVAELFRDHDQIGWASFLEAFTIPDTAPLQRIGVSGEGIFCSAGGVSRTVTFRNILW
jgi:hypothetical protein